MSGLSIAVLIFTVASLPFAFILSKRIRELDPVLGELYRVGFFGVVLWAFFGPIWGLFALNKRAKVYNTLLAKKAAEAKK